MVITIKDGIHLQLTKGKKPITVSKRILLQI